MTSSVNNATTVPPIPSSTLTEEESNFLRFINYYINFKNLDSKSKRVVLLTEYVFSFFFKVICIEESRQLTVGLFTLYIRYFHLMYVCKLLSYCQVSRVKYQSSNQSIT
jgi:hypothetical protein